MQWFQGVAEPFKCGNPGRLCIPGYCQSSTHGNNASWFSRPNSETVPECSENNSLSAGWSYHPQNHQAGLPEAQGAHPKTQRLSKFARVKKGGRRGFFAPWVALRARWGWNRSERVAFCGTRADIASTIAGFRPLCSQQATLLATFQKGNTGGVRGGVLGGQIPGLRTPIHRVADHPRGKLGRGRTT